MKWRLLGLPKPGSRRHVRTAAGSAVLPLLLTGCWSGQADQGTSASGAARNPTSAAPAKGADIRLPPGFDLAKGWSVDETRRVFTVDQRSGLVLDIYAAGNSAEQAREEASKSPSAAPSEASPSPSGSAGSTVSSVLIARRADNGEVAWSSTPMRRIMSEQVPMLRVVQTGQGPYVVVVRVGGLPTNGVARARQLVVADSFPIAGDSGERAPARHLEHMVEGDADKVDIVIGEGGVLMADEPSEEGTAKVIVWDPLSGNAVTQGAPATRQAPNCASDVRCGITEVPLHPSSAGTVFREAGASGASGVDLRFGVTGRWNSAAVTPAGRTQSRLLAVTPTVLLAVWRTDDKQQPPLYTVHDLATGQVRASVECTAGTPDFAEETEKLFGSGRDEELATDAQTSPNQRYLVSGAFSADLSAGTAACHAGNRDIRAVSLGSVDDAGVAYARLLDDDDEDPEFAVVRIGTGKIEALARGTVIPKTFIGQGNGVFEVKNGDAWSESKSSVLVAPPAPVTAPTTAPGTSPASGSPTATPTPSAR
ncbi:hypothetical protein [Yinghuangia soli]|uniref:Lipoprotein n=1 Tax=Yinghuangia soli TaxID=2908204 RepID=A0AA41PVP8_9ACTN|nr:hypothetical protein [Yinghuangia soli]MCF2526720.1 hypothetical protein [Yinghuangia soli]